MIAKTVSVLLLATLAFGANASRVLIRNDTLTPLYVVAKKSETDDYTTHTSTGELTDGLMVTFRADNEFLTGLNIHKGDDYFPGFLDVTTGIYIDCPQAVSGSSRSFGYRNGECVDLFGTDEIRIYNNTDNYVRPVVRRTMFAGELGDLIRPSGDTTLTSRSHPLKGYKIKRGETFILTLSSPGGENAVCASDIISGSTRSFEYKDGKCVEINICAGQNR